MIQAVLNAYGPRTKFVGKHPYAKQIARATKLSSQGVVAHIAKHPGLNTTELMAQFALERHPMWRKLRILEKDGHLRRTTLLEQMDTPHGTKKPIVCRWYIATTNCAALTSA